MLAVLSRAADAPLGGLQRYEHGHSILMSNARHDTAHFGDEGAAEPAGDPPGTPRLVHVSDLKPSTYHARYRGSLVDFEPAGPAGSTANSRRILYPVEWDLGDLPAQIAAGGLREPLIVGAAVGASTALPVISGVRRLVAVRWLIAHGVPIQGTDHPDRRALAQGLVPVVTHDGSTADGVLLATAHNWAGMSTWERALQLDALVSALAQDDPDIGDVAVAIEQRLGLRRRTVRRLSTIAWLLNGDIFRRAGFLRPDGLIDFPAIRALTRDQLEAAVNAPAGEERLAVLRAACARLTPGTTPPPPGPDELISPKFGQRRRARVARVDGVAEFERALRSGATVRVAKAIGTYTDAEARLALEKLGPVTTALATRLEGAPLVHVQAAGPGTVIVLPRATASLEESERALVAARLRAMADAVEGHSAASY